MNSDKYKKYVNKRIKYLRSNAPDMPNEKTIETRFQQELTLIFHEFFSKFGIKYRPTVEAATHTRYLRIKGRADTSIGSLIIEFKQPSTFSSNHNHKMQFKALKQGMSYADGFNKTGNTKNVVFATDGVYGGFYFKGETLTDLRATPFKKISLRDINIIIKSIIDTRSKILSANNLIIDFVKGNNALSIQLAKNLYDILHFKPSQKTSMLFTEWKHLFQLSHDDKSQQQDIITRRHDLSRILAIKIKSQNSEYQALFALQTSYAILIKLIAFKVISYEKFDDTLMQFSYFLTNNSNNLRIYLTKLENGSVIRKYGIHNLLEGDFFSWYTSSNQWNINLYKIIYNIVDTLSDYQSTISFFSRRNIQDFFKKLYQKIIPRSVRHTMGEYYTPYWLANAVIHKLFATHSITSNPRVLDPTCGSGTFLTVMIKYYIKKGNMNHINIDNLLDIILKHVVGIDINPLAVLTARINYFLNISSLLTPNAVIEIPVYSGDSAYTPKRKIKDGIELLQYTIDTKIGAMKFTFPTIALRNLKSFSNIMTDIEPDIDLESESNIFKRLISLVPVTEQRNDIIKHSLYNLSHTLVSFHKRNWDGIWARIIANYLTTFSLKKFDYIIGNLPWVDWKNLPSNYRNRIKSLPISKRIFSGDSQTGGINLNIAALILFVSIKKWLKPSGAVGVLMPNTFINQQTYEGFRKLEFAPNKRAWFYSIDDWSKAGHPFYPVTQKFFTYYISREPVNYLKGIPVRKIILKHNKDSYHEHLNFDKTFYTKQYLAIQTDPNRTGLTITNSHHSQYYSLIGKQKSNYRGREGLEIYPQELLMFTTINSFKDKVLCKNIRNNRAKFQIPTQTELFEKRGLRPMVKGTDITPFHINYHNIVVPFAYNANYSKRVAISENQLRQSTPNIYTYFKTFKKTFQNLNSYSRRLINGKNIPYYSIARVGDYTFAHNFVAFRDNSHNYAAVVSKIKTPWGQYMTPIFQNHAVTITQRPNGSFISLNEAYYIAGIYNCNIVTNFINDSFDSRSMPVTPRFQIPLYDGSNTIQIKISKLAKEATNNYKNKNAVNNIKNKISYLYIKLLNQLSNYKN